MNEAMLRKVLWIDATTCIASGLLMTAGASALAPVLGLPETFLRGSGLALFPVAAFIAAVALKAVRSMAAVSLVVAGNLVWVVGSFWVIDGGVHHPTTAGVAFTLAQAAGVLVLAALETRGALALRSTEAT